MKRKYISLLILLLGLCACGNSSRNESAVTEDTSMTTEKYKEVALKKFKGQASYIFNKTRSHVLCLKNPPKSDKSGMPNWRQEAFFFVYDLKKEQLILEDFIANGTVQWKNDHQLTISIIPGIIPAEGEDIEQILGYIYDVTLGRKTVITNKNIDSIKP